MQPSPATNTVPQTQRRLSITSRLRWSYLLSSTLPLLLIGALLIGTLYQVQQRNAFASQQAVADQLADAIATFLYDLEQQLLRAGRDLQPERSARELDSAARNLVNSLPDVRALRVVASDGAQVLEVSSDLLVTRSINPTDIDPALIMSVLSAGQGRRTTIMSGVDGQPIFHVVLPVRDPVNRRVNGAIAAEVSAARIHQMLRLAVQSKHKTAYVLDAQRQLLLLVGPLDWNVPADLSRLFDEGQTAGHYTGGDGQMVLGARAPVAPIRSSSWSVVVEQPSSLFFVEVYRSLALLAALVGVVSLLALISALVQSRRLLQPIQALATGAEELADGKLEHRIDVNTGDELEQLAATFNDMARRLQSSLHEIERQNEHFREGLVLARDIQQGLLPGAPPWRGELISVFGRSLPANEVGGDFYSYMVLPDGRAAVAIGDISGKGVAAALLMALTSSTLELQVHFIEHPAAMLQALHETLRPRLQANHMNAALLIAVFDADGRAVTVANAGMISPLLIRCGQSEQPGDCAFLDVGGLPIGTPLGGTYRELTVPIDPGDTLIFLSDGIVEAHNRSGEIFGFERLEALVSQLPPSFDVSAQVKQILAEVLGFVGDAEVHDDMTIIATRLADYSSSTPVAATEEIAVG